ncbi:putative transporter, MFS family protein [Catellatospora sp. IY07-71]|uniref:MFS transporter n=1 Tax=Catellatospora sp. IY07-71 TaxID=2728827 RepID=UPI001BB34D36|nr:MFS transporter [Catellatospora sp. IY07-71]BCJ75214.1 putative transporter, MFS family protein [Catellatospora sp. IY07-71]
MTAAANRAAAPARGGGTPATGHRLIAVLAATATVGYGVLYYTFSVVLHPIAATLHTSTAVITGAYTASVLVAAAAAIPVGRYLDRRSARGLMTGGAALGSLALAGLSQATQVWQVYAAFTLIGLAAATSLYEAAFTVVVHQLGPDRRAGAVLAITIVAGFASTIFIPTTGWLTEHHGWRTALLVLAALHAAVTITGHAVAIPAGAPDKSATHTPGSPHPADVRTLLDRGFWLLTISFVTHGIATSAVSVHLVGYLTHAGHPATTAAAIAGMLGALSVTGRIATTTLGRRHPITTTTAAVFALQAAAAAALPLLGGTVAGAVACVAVFGLGFGVGTIARPAIIVDRYGTTAYGAISGTLTVPITIAKAAAPLAVAGATGSILMAAVALLCLTAASALAGLRTAPRPAAVSDLTART